ncbi:hypothetical protein JGS22_016910 [Streptomyces sp. P38-E01]|uniref:Integral membrane protein n=1 Tax=Streptomyces tardus TaxID=2780544 RepID=A0A949JGY3_9ACTN|nr:hypothetical protein [Streptomyces tardus]MBU7599247.1 hypothetical protein [Streptomyces tardus]
MLGELFGSALLGLVLALAALHWLPRRFPNHRLVLATGPASAAGGGLIAWAVLGSGHLLLALLVATSVAAVLVSLLMDNGRAPQPGPADPRLATAGRTH